LDKIAYTQEKMDNVKIQVQKLMELDKAVSEEMRITPIRHIEKMRAEYKNKKK
jgi:hypothetical protein